MHRILIHSVSSWGGAGAGGLRVGRPSISAPGSSAAAVAVGLPRHRIASGRRLRRERSCDGAELRPQASNLNGEDRPIRGPRSRPKAEESSEIYKSSSSIYNYSVAKSMEQVARAAQAEGGPRTVRTGLWPATKESNIWGTMAYNYYNWRSGTGNDISVFLTLVTVVTGLVSVAGFALDSAYVVHTSAWSSVYEVVQLFFQDGFPDSVDAAQYKQVYSIFVATTGLIFFSILLALIEQLFLEVLERNVQRGSEVFEDGHYLVLSWMESALTLNAMWVVLQQICECHKSEGGVVVVVLCDESKVKTETAFARFIPEERRHGTKFVFRQGSPLIPDNLVRVAAKQAGSTIILSDASRAPEEADAQALRAAVLIDELFTQGEQRGNVVVELKTGVSAQLLRSVCTENIIPISTYNLNSIRLARLVQRPITAYVTNKCLDYASGCQHVVHSYPEMEGIPFRELKYFFPDATVMGLMNVREGRCAWMPRNAVVQPGDEIFMLQDPSLTHSDTRPCNRVYPDMSTETDARVMSQYFEDRLQVLESDIPSLSNWDKLYDKAYSEEDFDVGLVGNHDNVALSWASLEADPLAGQEPIAAQSEELKLSDLMERTDFKGDAVEDISASMDGISGLSSAASTRMSETEQEEWDQIGSSGERQRQKSEKARVLIIGCAEDQFMIETIQEMDRGLCGAEITLFNKHMPVEPGWDYRDILGSTGELKLISVGYIHGDPLKARDLGSLPLDKFDTVIILCDKGWLDPDVDSTNGIDARDTADMLRMDSMVMMVQVHIRELLSRKKLKNIKMITEKVAFEGSTRFEDPLKLPLGFSLNRKDFAAKILAQVACQPKILPIISAGAQGTNFEMRDPNLFVAPGEAMNYWALMQRVEDYNEHLLGYVELPRNSARSLDIVINPKALVRDKKIAWGSRQLKLITTSRRVENLSGVVSKEQLRMAEAMEVACQKRKHGGGWADQRATGANSGPQGTGAEVMSELEKAMSDIRRRRANGGKAQEQTDRRIND